MKYKNIFYTTLLILALTSCRDKFQRYDIDETLDPYLQMFLQEAAKRGKNFHVEENGLIMEFTDLPNTTIGLCTYQDPLLVQIDAPYWEETKKYEDQENLRQNVVFHELGHGLLNRAHDNSLLPNKEWKTIMCGGDQVPGRDWSINFNGYRKAYYMDELFNIRTTAPEWSQLMEYQEKEGTLLFSLELDIDYYRDTLNVIKSVKDQILSLQSNEEGDIPIQVFSTPDISSDFTFEVTMKHKSKGKDALIGPFAVYDHDLDGDFQYKPRTTQNPVNDGFNYMTANVSIDGTQFFLLNSNCGLPIAEIVRNGVYKENEFNQFIVSRHDGEIFFYLNGQLIFRNDYQADKPYLGFGILLPSQDKIEISSSHLYTKGSALRAGKEARKITPAEMTVTYKSVQPRMKIHNNVK
ncbi:MAG: hypothetical protein MJZ14_05050 [Paludibacteraceae bacterium]|nr:hypothetical protein [Paludibacteraceae bacterium]